jgi:hypothetical protein
VDPRAGRHRLRRRRPRTAHFAAVGPEVTGLARTPEAAGRLAGHGVAALAGDLDGRRDEVLSTTARTNVVVYAAQPEPGIERKTVEAVVNTLAGTGKTLLFTSGTGVFLQRTAGAWGEDGFAEDEPFTVEPPAVEQRARAAVADGVRAMVIRPGQI